MYCDAMLYDMIQSNAIQSNAMQCNVTWWVVSCDMMHDTWFDTMCSLSVYPKIEYDARLCSTVVIWCGITRIFAIRCNHGAMWYVVIPLYYSTVLYVGRWHGTYCDVIWHDAMSCDVTRFA
jgi:hypothetical protein